MVFEHFWLSKDSTLVSYILKEQKVVILVSSLHKNKSIDPDAKSNINNHILQCKLKKT